MDVRLIAGETIQIPHLHAVAEKTEVVVDAVYLCRVRHIRPVRVFGVGDRHLSLTEQLMLLFGGQCDELGIRHRSEGRGVDSEIVATTNILGLLLGGGLKDVVVGDVLRYCGPLRRGDDLVFVLRKLYYVNANCSIISTN